MYYRINSSFEFRENGLVVNKINQPIKLNCPTATYT